MYGLHAPEPAGSVRNCPETLHALEAPSSADEAAISPAVLVDGAEEAGPQGTEPGRRGRHRRHETAESDMGLPTDRATDRPGLRGSHEQGCGATHYSPCGTSRSQTRRGRLGSRSSGTRSTVCRASICFDATRPSCAHTGCSW